MHFIFVALDQVHKELGTGHIIRVSRLLDLMFSKDSQFEDSTIKLFSNNVDAIERFDGIYVEDAQSAKNIIIEYLNTYKVDVAFFDCLDYFSDIYDHCKLKNIISICVDISDESSPSPDLIINPVIKHKDAFLSGPLYSMHYEIEVEEFIRPDERENHIFICFGGIDFQNYLSKVVPYLKNVLSDFRISIVVSRSSDLELYNNLPNNIQLYYKPHNFYEILQSASLALISGGVILQEASYLGVPSIIFPQYPHQYKAALEKKSEGSSLEVVPVNKTLKNFSSVIYSLMIQPSLLNRASLDGRASDDGFGIKRVINILQIIEYLEWDSKFFKKNIYSITSKCYTKRIEYRLNKLIEKKSVDLVYFLCPKADKKSLKNATESGFIQVDQRLTYLIRANSFLDIDLESNLNSNYSIVKSIAEDTLELGNLAKEIKWTTRYTNDKNFDSESIEKFYEEWVIKSIVGKLDDAVYHIRQNGEICGFISIKKMGINMGSIGLVGVSSHHQGKGIGIALTNFAVDLMINSMGCAAVQVVTQSTNIGACKTYEKIGFTPSDQSIWFHKWVNKK